MKPAWRVAGCSLGHCNWVFWDVGGDGRRWEGALLDSHSGEEALGLLSKIQESAEASDSQKHRGLKIGTQEGHQRG